MIDSLLLYFRYIRHSVAAQLQYRASFIMLSIGHLLTTGIEFFGIWALFNRFGSLAGWTLPEVALFYGTIQIAFAFADALGRGFDVFAGRVKTGEFDRLLLRPRSTVLQLFGYELTTRRVGRLVQGVAILIYAVVRLDFGFSPVAFALILLTIFGTVLLFIGLYIVQATIAFWTVETLEIMNTMTYGGVQSAQYPMSIYRTWFKRFFTFVVPLMCVAYFPLATLIDRGQSPQFIGWITPLAGPLFFAGSLWLWRFGIRHYTSTGS